MTHSIREATGAWGEAVLKRFRYTARDAQGALTKGVMDVDSAEEVYQRLKQENLYCLRLQVDDASRAQDSRHKMKLKDVALFCRQMSTMLAAGVTVVKALDLLYARSDNARNRASFLRLSEDIQKGLSFCEALREQGGFYPALLVNMVQAGERSGSLDAVMQKMSDHYEKEYRLVGKVRTSMAYPILLVVVTLAVMIGLFVFVLPRFFVMFEGAELPGITRAVMAISHFLINDWYILIVAAAALALLAALLRQVPRVRRELDRIKLYLPLMGRQLRTIYVARLTHAMSILYASGIPMIDAVEMSVSVLNNRYLTERFIQVVEDISRGEMLSTALEKTGLFDPMVPAMTSIGEESGRLEQMLVQLSSFYDSEAEAAVQRLVSLLEPVMLVVIALVVGVIVAAVILPIYSMYASVI
jgi:type IV pilus assembly protein PilC